MHYSSLPASGPLLHCDWFAIDFLPCRHSSTSANQWQSARQPFGQSLYAVHSWKCRQIKIKDVNDKRKTRPFRQLKRFETALKIFFLCFKNWFEINLTPFYTLSKCIIVSNQRLFLFFSFVCFSSFHRVQNVHRQTDKHFILKFYFFDYFFLLKRTLQIENRFPDPFDPSEQTHSKSSGSK